MRIAMLATLTSLPLLVACGPGGREGAWAGTVDTTASGAVVVRNTGRGGWDSAAAWRLVEELRIGSVDDSGPGAISNPRALEVDAAGRIYVVENQPMELRVYAPEGRYLRTLMRTGSGPGEVQEAIGLVWDPAGHLWVVDQRNARYTVFDTAGARLAEHRRPVSGFFTWQWAGTITRAGEVLEVTSVPGGGEFRQVAVSLDNALAATDTFPLPRWQGPVFELNRAGMRAAIGVPFAPALVWRLDPRGYIWSSITDRYRMVQQSLRGDTVRIIEREVEPVPVTGTEKDSGIARLRSFVQQGGVVDRSRIPDVKPPIERLWLDDLGYLWTRRSQTEGARGTLLDVFDPAGRFLGEILAPLALQTVLIRGTALYATATGEDDVPVIVRFLIRGR
jgi:hypothetical protein